MAEQTTSQRLAGAARLGAGGVMFGFPAEAIIIVVGAPAVWLATTAEHHWGFWSVAAAMASIVCGVPFLVGFLIGWVENQASTRGRERNITYTPGSAPNPHPWQSGPWYAHENLMEQQRQTAALGRPRD